MQTEQKRIPIACDVAVVGGGIAGLCAAIASARNGADTVLVQDRPVLGGNASSEIRMHICGATGHGSRPNVRESGILEELLLENKRRNPEHSFALFDTVLWEKAAHEPNLSLYLNTHAYELSMDGERIQSVTARQMTTEKTFLITADIFMDCTGDGLLAAMSGAACMYGRDARSAFDEPGAVEEASRITMGNTIQFHAYDAGHPVPFQRPFWAENYRDDVRIQRLNFAEITSGYWWIELGGTRLDVVEDSQEIQEELLKVVFGLWDYIKNCGVKGSENMVLDWFNFLPAKRESRRVVGDYVLREQDLTESRVFDDAVAYGGWHIDSHEPEKYYAWINQSPQTEDATVPLKDIYTIPYRCLYARDVGNLMLGGRAISASHRALASTRVMGTCAVAGQAAGTAAAMAVKAGLTPRQMGERIHDLQQQLMKDDCFIPGFRNEDPLDLARNARVTCSSLEAGVCCDDVTNGVSRTVKEEKNGWFSAPLSPRGEWLALNWEQPVSLSQVRLTFDSDLSIEIMPSLSKWVQDREEPCVPQTLVSDYRVVLLKGGEEVHSVSVTGNYQRHRIHSFEQAFRCDCVKVEISATNGCPEARIFEIRVY